MNNIKKKYQILDCTLRDGIKITNANIKQNTAKYIIDNLSKSKVDLIEVGYLINQNSAENSMLFQNIKDIENFVNNTSDLTEYVAFIDYQKYNPQKLPNSENTVIKGIRFGFTYKDFLTNFADITNAIKIIQDKGYNLFLQPMNTVKYNDSELTELIVLANEVMPHSFGIIDTYGRMEENDLTRLYNTISKKLNNRIKINFHSHDNIQKSFLLAEKLIQISKQSPHSIIIDGTLNGIGRCAGNIKTEEITKYLNENFNGYYDINTLESLIKKEITPLREIHDWKYDITYEICARKEIHPQYAQYLSKQKGLSTDEKIKILNSIPKNAKEKFDENLIIELINN